MARSLLPTPERLRQLLSYDPETGDLTWRPRDIEEFSWRVFSPQSACDTWNRDYAGRPAFHLNARGYLVSKVDGRPLYAHRVAWAIVHGAWPEGVIDHINRDPSDNRIVNLRDVSQQENNRNRSLRSGAGVDFRASRGKWRARIMVNYKDVSLGHYATEAEARAARDAAERKLETDGAL